MKERKEESPDESWWRWVAFPKVHPCEERECFHDVQENENEIIMKHTRRHFPRAFELTEEGGNYALPS